MAYRAAVIGASGYTGAEALRLLAAHPEIDVVHVTAHSHAGARVGDVFPSLRAAYPAAQFVPFAPADLDGIDLALVALPHGESQDHMAAITARVAHVVDIGADFRLPAEDYAQWYGEPHRAPELIASFAFGLTELFRAEIRRFAHVANPGCYPTAAALALAPLLAHHLVDPATLVVDAISGVSGRGRGLSVPSLFSESNENVAAYGLLTHRHTAEMELALGAVSGTPGVRVLFTPHLAPLTRGILATCHARPADRALTTAALLELYRGFYATEPFVLVVDEPPATKATAASNAVHVTVRADERTGGVVAIAALDNLVKGASGQAVQNANLLLGLPETLGLTAVGTAP